MQLDSVIQQISATQTEMTQVTDETAVVVATRLGLLYVNCVSICVSECLSVCLSVCVSVCLSVCLYINCKSLK